MGCNLNCAIRILNGCARLHNFIIDQNQDEEATLPSALVDDPNEIMFTQGETPLGYIHSDINNTAHDMRRNKEFDPADAFVIECISKS